MSTYDLKVKWLQNVLYARESISDADQEQFCRIALDYQAKLVMHEALLLKGILP